MLKIDLTGKTALVTCSTNELGQRITSNLAKCGADIALHHANQKDEASTQVKELRELGRRAFSFSADLTDSKEISQLNEKIGAKLNYPDIVITNTVTPIEPLNAVEEKGKKDDYFNFVETSTTTNIQLIKTFLPAMRRSQWGRFVSVTSICAMNLKNLPPSRIRPRMSMDGVLASLLTEAIPGEVTINQVAPSLVIPGKKDMKDIVYQDLKAMVNKQAIETANIVTFLASDLAGYINGAYIPATGKDEPTAEEIRRLAEE